MSEALKQSDFALIIAVKMPIPTGIRSMATGHARRMMASAKYPMSV